MIYEVKMFAGKCDNCGKEWLDDHNGWCAMNGESELLEQMMNDDWVTSDNDNKQHYCPDCYSYDDNDILVLKQFPLTPKH